MTDTAPEGEILELPDPRIEEHEVNAVLLGATSAAERLAALQASAALFTASSSGGLIGAMGGFTSVLPKYRHADELIQLAEYVLDDYPPQTVSVGAIIGTITACDCNTPKPGTEETPNA